MLLAPGVNPGLRKSPNPFSPMFEREGPGVSSSEIPPNKFGFEFI